MQLKKYTSLLLFALLSATGCGNGSQGFINSIPTATDVSGTSLPPTGSGASLTGCTRETFVPNFSSKVSLYHWAKFPLKVHFSNSGVVTKSDGSKLDLTSVALRGFEQWKTATSSGVDFQETSDPAQADVIVHFGTLAHPPSATDYLGVEQSSVFQDGAMKSADILLNTWVGMTDDNIRSFEETCAHEFGHALGLNGHSDATSDVMFSIHLLDSMKLLTTRDINTLKTSYCDQFGRKTSIKGEVSTVSIAN